MQFGITVIETIKFIDGVETTIKSHEERVKVTNEQEEIAEFIKFHRDTKRQQRIGFKYDIPKGKDYYYIIKCWREVV